MKEALIQSIFSYSTSILLISMFRTLVFFVHSKGCNSHYKIILRADIVACTVVLSATWQPWHPPSTFFLKPWLLNLKSSSLLVCTVDDG